MSVIFNSTDISVRLSKAKYCAGQFAFQIANEFSNGMSSAECNLRKLKLLNTYIEILCEYTVGSTDNCITETKMQNICEEINKICRICSATPNTTYITN